MKITPTIIAAFAAAALAHAAPPPSPTSASGTLTLPVPLRVVHPMDLPRWFEDQNVNVEFTLDAAGVPHDVTTKEALPAGVARRLLPAIAQWRFTPCLRNGHPVAIRVVMPLEVVVGDLAKPPVAAGGFTGIVRGSASPLPRGQSLASAPPASD